MYTLHPPHHVEMTVFQKSFFFGVKLVASSWLPNHSLLHFQWLMRTRLTSVYYNCTHLQKSLSHSCCCFLLSGIVFLWFFSLYIHACSPSYLVSTLFSQFMLFLPHIANILAKLWTWLIVDRAWNFENFALASPGWHWIYSNPPGKRSHQV